MNQAMPILDNELWSLLQPLIPPAKPRRTRYPGRKPLEDRAVMSGILYVLETGIPWGQLPQDLGFGSGMSCWRRLRDWQQAGAWGDMHALLLRKMRSAEKVDWERVLIDSPSSRAARTELEVVVVDVPAPAEARQPARVFGVQPAGVPSLPPMLSALAPAQSASAQAPVPRSLSVAVAAQPTQRLDVSERT